MKNSNNLTERQSGSSAQHNENNDFTDALKKDGQKLKENASEIKDKVGNKMEETMEEVKAKTSEAQAALTSYVKENPFKALGWAVLAGAAVGILLRK